MIEWLRQRERAISTDDIIFKNMHISIYILYNMHNRYNIKFIVYHFTSFYYILLTWQYIMADHGSISYYSLSFSLSPRFCSTASVNAQIIRGIFVGQTGAWRKLKEPKRSKTHEVKRWAATSPAPGHPDGKSSRWNGRSKRPTTCTFKAGNLPISNRALLDWDAPSGKENWIHHEIALYLFSLIGFPLYILVLSGEGAVIYLFPSFSTWLGPVQAMRDSIKKRQKMSK